MGVTIRRRASSLRVLGVAAALSTLWAVGTACPVFAAGFKPHDPVRVHYPAGECTTGVLEVELFNRVVKEWRPHPAHARILADTCQTEDAGDLLNELRVRCIDPGNPARASDWLMGVQVYQPASAPGCVSPQIGVSPKRSPRIQLTRPGAKETVRTATGLADVAGKVELTHDLVIVVDATFEPETAAAVRSAVQQLVERDGSMVGPLRIGFLRYGPGRPAKGDLALLDDRGAVEGAMSAALKAGAPVRADGFASALDTAREKLAGKERSGHRNTVLAFANGDAAYPLGGAAGNDPKLRSRILDAVNRSLQAGVAIQIFAVGGRERDLAELVDQIRERVTKSGLPGGVAPVESAAELPSALPQFEIVTLQELRIENLANGVLAESPSWTRAGRFEGSVPMATGRNLLRVRAQLSDGQSIVADFDRNFDPAALQEALRKQERERIERSRAEREGKVTIDVEDR